MTPNRNAVDPIDRTDLEPAEVGGPIDAVKGDATAHRSTQDAKTRKEADEAVGAGELNADSTGDLQRARIESGLPPDGNLDPKFEGTQPKLLVDGTLAVVGMQDLKEASAEFDGETVAQQEKAAGLEVGQSKTPLANELEEIEEEMEEEEEVEDGESMTVAELKEALDEAGIEYSSSDRKADLQKLYSDNLG